MKLIDFGEPASDYTNPPLRTFKQFTLIDDLSVWFYQGEKDSQGRKDGRGIEINRKKSTIQFSHYKEGLTHGPFTLIEKDGTKLQGKSYMGRLDG